MIDVKTNNTMKYRYFLGQSEELKPTAATATLPLLTVTSVDKNSGKKMGHY